MNLNPKNILLRTQLVLFSVIAVGLAVAVVTAVSLSMFRADILSRVNQDQEAHLKLFWELLSQKGNEFHLEGNQLMVGDYTLNENYELPDRIKSLTGGAASIFLGDTRIATNVMTAEGKRAIGTKLQGAAYEALLRRGVSYRGESVLLGQTYSTAYDPIRDAQGKVIGILVVGIDKESYFASFYRLERSILWWAGLTLLLIAGCMGLYTRYAFAPLAQAATAATAVAAGDLTGEFVRQRRDETGIVLGALHQMIGSLRLLIGQVRSSSIQLTSAANQIGATANVQRGSMTELNESCSSAIQSAQEIAAIGQHVLETMEHVSFFLEGAVASANTGQSRLSEMDEAMRELMFGAEVVSSQLAEIDLKTAKINQAVLVMTKVADQTNLLSLNAAIEAKKAGEAGKGFTVLAEEISRLADQSAAGTLEIEKMAHEVKTAVASGVAEMARYGQKVERGVQASADTNQQLSKIIRLVQQLMPQFVSVTDSMRAQYSSGQQILTTIRKLSDGAQATTNSIQNLQEAAEHLNGVVKGLRTEVGRFKLNS